MSPVPDSKSEMRPGIPVLWTLRKGTVAGCLCLRERWTDYMELDWHAAGYTVSIKRAVEVSCRRGRPWCPGRCFELAAERRAADSGARASGAQLCSVAGLRKARDGNGQAAFESCCGQRDTAYPLAAFYAVFPRRGWIYNYHHHHHHQAGCTQQATVGSQGE